MSSFVHLHLHTQYSLLDAACRIGELMDRTKELGMPAVALTDHGNMFGAIEFYQKATKKGIKPIIGCEVYLAEGSRFDQQSVNGKKPPNHHFLLLAKNGIGYKNLVKLVSAAHLEGFYYKPRIDHEILKQHSEGLIATTACLFSDVAQAVLQNRHKDAEHLIGFYKELFKDDFYLEIQNHGLEEQKVIREQYRKYSKQFNIPLVATNDVHYVKAEHASPHDILLCIGSGAKLTDEKRRRYPCQEFYLKSAEQMREIFKDDLDAVENTLAIAEKCNVEIDFKSNKYPEFPQPPNNQTRDEYLRDIAYKGLEDRYGADAKDQKIIDRLEYEIEVIKKMGFISYFLITWDFINYAKSNEIPVGPGRGSGAGSILAYCMKITDLDPLRWGLIFERFLNPERVSPPDFDIDFCQDRREEVIDYVKAKYGERSVAQIITFGTLGAKMAIRDVARVMGYSFGDASRVADMIPKDPKITITKAFDENPEFKQLYDTDDNMREVIDNALALEGVVRQTGIHAAGVIISDRDLTEFVPLTKDDKGTVATQYSMEPLTDLGMLKMDFLGLKTLTVIKDAIDMIDQNHNIKIDPLKMPLDDPKTLALLNRAENIGVFQVESPGMRKTCANFDIQGLEDVIALIALYRPGPMDLIDEYIKRKKGLVTFEYEHPLLEKVSKETYGIMIYQEQVMDAARVLAGYSLGGADLLRRAMGKKKPEEMEKQKAIFIEGCKVTNNIPEEKAKSIFELLEKFAGYGFNKSHSAAYALISFQTAYLKANYPVEFMAALMSNDLDNTEKLAIFTAESKRMGIKILPPSVNESIRKFSTGPNQIRYGLSAIKNVGDGPVKSILDARAEGGAFTSIEDLAKRIDARALNKKTMESLVKSGALDCFGYTRAYLFEQIDSILGFATSNSRDRDKGQSSLFDGMAMDDVRPLQFAPRHEREWPMRERLGYEKELLGFYVTGHPADEYESALQYFRTANIAEYKELDHDQILRLAGVIVQKEVRVSKEGKPYARLQLEDLTGSTEVMVFSNAYQKMGSILEDGQPFIATGRVDKSQDEMIRFKTMGLTPLAESFSKNVQGVTIEASSAEAIEPLKNMIKNFKGKKSLKLELPSNGKKVILELGSDYSVTYTWDFYTQVQQLEGIKGLRLEVKELSDEPYKPRNYPSSRE